MRKRFTYETTVFACYLGYVVQAIINNLGPLLFVQFHTQYDIPLFKITFLVTLNFGLQLLIDLLSAFFIDRIGYRASMVIAGASAIAGLLLLSVLPDMLPDPFVGILISIMIYAVGGGLCEVLLSPIVESCPTEHKEAAMSMLHAAYSWGSVAVVLLSTIFLHFMGVGAWPHLARLWAVVPAFTMFLFCFVPIRPLVEEGQESMSIVELFTDRLFWVLFLMMICSGASEQAVSQWASTFAEKGLKVTKTVGDLAGPMFFSAMFGLSRTIYGKLGDKLPLESFFRLSVLLCLAGYIVIVFSPFAFLSLIGCGIVGFAVGIFWPGTFSFAAKGFPRGGTLMFSFLALAGDVGCGGGPTLAGMVSGALGDNLKLGILAAIVFPLIMACATGMYSSIIRSRSKT